MKCGLRQLCPAAAFGAESFVKALPRGLFSGPFTLSGLSDRERDFLSKCQFEGVPNWVRFR